MIDPLHLVLRPLQLNRRISLIGLDLQVAPHQLMDCTNGRIPQPLPGLHVAHPIPKIYLYLLDFLAKNPVQPAPEYLARIVYDTAHIHRLICGLQGPLEVVLVGVVLSGYAAEAHFFQFFVRNITELLNRISSLLKIA